MFFSPLSDEKISALVISSKFYAQNYWVPTQAPYFGQLQNYWNEIVASGVKYMRVGGKAYDGQGMWSVFDLKNIILIIPRSSAAGFG